jgi:Transposase zinc-binding domain/Putative transposase
MHRSPTPRSAIRKAVRPAEAGEPGAGLSVVAPVLEVAEVFRRHGDVYRQVHAGHLARTEVRVMSAITAYRTAALGGHTEACGDCGLVRIAYNSCRNRHCPKCQGLARAEWLADRQAELLPVPYFHVVFTVPTAVAAIAFQNKARVYAILFRAAAETLRTIAADPRHLGAEIGLVAVLHSWGQNLLHHPHVHCLVPGGGLSPDGTRWISCRAGFFLPVRVLSRLFRRLFLEHLQAEFEHLSFFGTQATMADRSAFNRSLAELRRIDCRVDGDVAAPSLTDPDVRIPRIRFFTREIRSRRRNRG